ncbi:LysE family transporter [Xanthobacter dioxanivorans]|uniref:LysE family transporter n=1 Tax=Xanthobacter dioxanivorans TaxID=2528964 RepID=A0A974PLK5_9HYPH|nr:LysE family transporter [Xanthobacter dioxanivorans]QRG05850.1 LysE family transporter [Xanthobacter dioxanivorans]
MSIQILPDQLLPLLLFSIVASVTPGPNNLISAASGARFGFWRTLPQMAGVAAGFPLLVIAIGLGLGRLFVAVPALHLVLKLAGAAYLLYLAYGLLRADAPDAPAASESAPSFLGSAAFQWVNPKAWTIALSVIPAFVRPEGDVLPQVLLVALVFLLTAVPSLMVWALFGVALSRLLSEEKLRRRVNGLLAASVAASVILLFF